MILVCILRLLNNSKLSGNLCNFNETDLNQATSPKIIDKFLQICEQNERINITYYEPKNHSEFIVYIINGLYLW